jgi:hypothetical protein
VDKFLDTYDHLKLYQRILITWIDL